MKVVIVGGVAAGMSCATRLRRLVEDAEIVVLERGEHVSFANCGLPYYLGDVITQRPALLLQTPESLHARFRIDVRVRHEVRAIDLTARTVRVADLATGVEADEGYDELVLATGASAIRLDVPGGERALVLRDIADVDRMVEAVASARTATVVGAGFVGVELAENLARRGLTVTLVEKGDHVLPPLDPELAVLVADRLAEHGVDVRTGVAVASATEHEAVLDDGTRVSADLLVAAIGVRPESALAREAGLAVSKRGEICVDERFRTSNEHVYAVGDVAEKVDAVSGDATLVPLANPANRHGRLLADVLAGREIHVAPVQGTAIVGVFGLQAAMTGWSETRLREARREHVVIHAHPVNHAGYYPGAAQVALKLLCAPDGEILGAQGVGAQGVDKRIDVIATAMRGGLRAQELADLELAYAPQFGSAKDAVNFLGWIAENVLSGTTETIQWHELVDSGVPLVDVRTPGEFAAGAIPGSINVPLDELRERLDEIADDSVVHCQVGLRGHLAARILAQAGKHTRNLDGGYKTWSAGVRSGARLG